MVWRLADFLIEGELDNTVLDNVTGWMKFIGKREIITFNLSGNFHRDIRGRKIRFFNESLCEKGPAKDYLGTIHRHQTGKVGYITAGMLPASHISSPHFEFHTNQNGHIVIELAPSGAWAIQVLCQFVNPISHCNKNRKIS